eukprot:m51a1_g11572 hypothetical protein (761) ;mRNA; r:399-18110
MCPMVVFSVFVYYKSGVYQLAQGSTLSITMIAGMKDTRTATIATILWALAAISCAADPVEITWRSPTTATFWALGDRPATITVPAEARRVTRLTLTFVSGGVSCNKNCGGTPFSHWGCSCYDLNYINAVVTDASSILAGPPQNGSYGVTWRTAYGWFSTTEDLNSPVLEIPLIDAPYRGPYLQVWHGEDWTNMMDDDNEGATEFSYTVSYYQREKPHIAVGSIAAKQVVVLAITRSMIRAAQEDSTPAQLSFAVVQVSHARFELLGSPATRFTQEDIDSGRVALANDNGTVAPSFVLSVSDGHLNATTGTVTVSYTLANYPPVVTANAISATEGAVTVLDGSMIASSDTENDSVTFTVVAASHCFFALASSRDTKQSSSGKPIDWIFMMPLTLEESYNVFDKADFPESSETLLETFQMPWFRCLIAQCCGHPLTLFTLFETAINLDKRAKLNNNEVWDLMMCTFATQRAGAQAGLLSFEAISAILQGIEVSLESRPGGRAEGPTWQELVKMGVVDNTTADNILFTPRVSPFVLRYWARCTMEIARADSTEYLVAEQIAEHLVTGKEFRELSASGADFEMFHAAWERVMHMLRAGTTTTLRQHYKGARWGNPKLGDHPVTYLGDQTDERSVQQVESSATPGHDIAVEFEEDVRVLVEAKYSSPASASAPKLSQKDIEKKCALCAKSSLKYTAVVFAAFREVTSYSVVSEEERKILLELYGPALACLCQFYVAAAQDTTQSVAPQEDSPTERKKRKGSEPEV